MEDSVMMMESGDIISIPGFWMEGKKYHTNGPRGKAGKSSQTEVESIPAGGSGRIRAVRERRVFLSLKGMVSLQYGRQGFYGSHPGLGNAPGRLPTVTEWSKQIRYIPAPAFRIHPKLQETLMRLSIRN